MARWRYLLPHFLHGKSVAQIFHWPAQPANEFYSNNRSSLAHSWSHSLADVGEVLRVALDVRRLNNEMAAFVEAPAEVAILYSQTSTLQLPAGDADVADHAVPGGTAQDLRGEPVSGRQGHLRDGAAGAKRLAARYKLLLVPGARNLPSAVVDGHLGIRSEWRPCADRAGVPAGRRIQPDAKDYLARLGIAIRETRRPRPAGAGGMVQGYDQSFSQDVTYVDDAAVRLTGTPGTPGPLQARGVRQVVAAAAPGTILYRYPDGSPAIVRTRLGNGAVTYAACSIDSRSYARLLDSLFDEAKVNRQARVRGADTWRVEARFARAGNRKLLYVVEL